MKKIFFSLLLLTGLVSAKYNQTSAAAYALTYAKNHNYRYRYYNGNDCTNFISQALKAGGIKYDYYGNSDYKKWYKYSPSWQLAAIFRYRAKKGGFGSVRIKRNQLEVGDIVIFDFKFDGKERYGHVTMVTDVRTNWFGKKYYYLSYHSTDRKNISLTWVEDSAEHTEYYRPRW